MTAKRYIRPFAYGATVGQQADRAEIPDDGDNTSSVNYNTGYNARYALQYGVNPQALPVERQYFNGLMYDITSTLQDWQIYCFPEWFDYSGTTSPALSYSSGSLVRYRTGSSGPFTLYRCLADGTITVPTDTTKWEVVPTVGELLDSVALMDKYPNPAQTPDSGDFNNISFSAERPNDGLVIRFDSDSKVRGWLNAPPIQVEARTGVLEQYRIPRTGAAGVIQRYSDYLGNIYARSYNGASWSAWVNITQKGGATGAGDDKVFYLNDQAVKASYSIPNNQNAMTAGPITINNGATVTIPNGSTWTVV